MVAASGRAARGSTAQGKGRKARAGARGQSSQSIQTSQSGARAKCATGDARAYGNPARTSIYDDVTARIIAELEAGRIPWVQPWDRAACAPSMPRNAVTKRAYSGINVLILWGAGIGGGYPTQGWLTFHQAFAAGGAVRRGERGTGIYYADRFTPESEKTRASEAGEDAKSVAFLKRFTVFNVAQIDGLPDDLTTAAPPCPECQIHDIAEGLIAASGADFRIGGQDAFYAPDSDYVQVPPPAAFRGATDYYCTALHELGHWTGHASRLARDQTGAFGSAGYAREELVALSGQSAPSATLQ